MKRAARKPRTVYADPMRVARNIATTLTPAELAQISVPVRAAFDRLRKGAATSNDWRVLAGSLMIARNIERQGVVRGLAEHLDSADRALVSVARASTATSARRAGFAERALAASGQLKLFGGAA